MKLPFVDDSLNAVGTAKPELLDAALMSRARRFVGDPELYLRRVELGGFEDARFSRW
jgi:hypothetical protein